MRKQALPPPDCEGGIPLTAALARRRSVREFAQRALAPAEVGQLLWAAQGVTDARAGQRSSPSAGALYPLIVYAALAGGLFRNVASGHLLEQVSARDLRRGLAAAALGQEEIAHAPCVLVLTAVFARTARKYGAFADARVAELLGLAHDETPLYLVPVGAPQFRPAAAR